MFWGVSREMVSLFIESYSFFQSCSEVPGRWRLLLNGLYRPFLFINSLHSLLHMKAKLQFFLPVLFFHLPSSFFYFPSYLFYLPYLSSISSHNHPYTWFSIVRRKTTKQNKIWKLEKNVEILQIIYPMVYPMIHSFNYFYNPCIFENELI